MQSVVRKEDSLRWWYPWFVCKSTDRGMQRRRYRTITPTCDRWNIQKSNSQHQQRSKSTYKIKRIKVESQLAFFDKRVFDPNVNRYLNKAFDQCYIQNEKEKKWYYNKRVCEIDQGSFTSFVSSIYGARKIAEKRGLHQSIVTNWIQTKIPFALLNLALQCLRRPRSISRNVCFVGNNIETAHEVVKI